MKNKLSLATIVVLALAVLVTFGCGTSPKTESTLVPKATSLPPATATPKPLPDPSTTRISLDELPAGFKEIPMDNMFSKAKAAGNEEYIPDAVFGFVSTKKFQIILGMNYLLDSATIRLGFGGMLDDADKVLKDYAGALGGTNIREAKVVEKLDVLGDQQTAMTMLADVKGTPMRIDGVIFRKDMIGGVILSMTGEGETPNISLQELAKLLDQHIQKSLATAQ